MVRTHKQREEEERLARKIFKIKPQEKNKKDSTSKTDNYRMKKN